jgi:hypothetical protein
MGYAVYQYFQNGGRNAIIIRVYNGTAGSATATATTGFEFAASNPGEWGNNLQVEIGIENPDDIRDLVDAEEALERSGTTSVNTLFNLIVKEKTGPNDPNPAVRETFRNLSAKSSSPKFVTRILQEQSSLIRATQVPTPPTQPAAAAAIDFQNGSDGADLTSANIIGTAGPPKTGLFTVEDIDLFNILCIPPYIGTLDTTTPPDMYTAVYPAALGYCERKRAILILDTPVEWNSANQPVTNIDGSAFRPLRHRNAVVYFPSIIAPDPKDDNNLRPFVPCGALAGVMARTDSERGVWKSPAGIEATLFGVPDLKVNLTNDENGALNQLGVNCLRVMPPAGIVVWGARTMRGPDRLADQWKYLAVRRTALYIEESLYRGTQWVVFEPNDEPLWAQIRLNVGAFMHNLFRQGAFQGTSPKEAYFVKCDKETTTQYDIDRGVVNIIVGFAPLKPAEFVILQIQQITRSSGP